MGLVSLARGDIKGMRPLAVKVGGFPKKIEYFEQFIKVVKMNKEGLFVGKPIIPLPNGIVVHPSQHGNPGGAPADDKKKDLDDDRSKWFNPKTIFKHFANSRGTMGFEEFANLFRQLNLTISHARMLQIFSAADTEKRGELT